MMSVTGETYNEEGKYSFTEVERLIPNLRIPAIRSKEQAWAEFEGNLSGRVKVAKQRSLSYLISIAAGLALLIGVSVWLYTNHYTKVWCQPANMEVVFLPDSSQVTLNAASTLKFNAKKWNNARRVYLDGEAFFRVKEGSRFEVVTSSGTVWVLGTTFNVFARYDRLEVYCETGKVSVISADTMILTPGMKAQTAKDAKVQSVKAEQQHEGTWQNGEFWFNNKPLTEVIAEIERQFDVTVIHDNLDHRYYTGYFSRRSLDEALSTVLYPMQLKYKIENRKIQIIK